MRLEISTELLTAYLTSEENFIFVRFGDGALECIAGRTGKTCDGEQYSEALGKDLIRVWDKLFTGQPVFIGDWFTASFDEKSNSNRYADEYSNLIAHGRKLGKFTPLFIHFESLLLMRQSPQLLTFYRKVRQDKRKKLLIGPEAWSPASELLNCEFFGIPVLQNLHKNIDCVIRGLESTKFDVLLYGAGMAGNIPVIDHWSSHTNKTYINLGSALDPLYRGRTRQQQMSKQEAQSFLSQICS